MMALGGNVERIIRRSLLLLVWQLATSVALLLLGGIVLGLPVWLLDGLEARHLAVMYVAYLVSTAFPSVLVIMDNRAHPLVPVLPTAMIFLGAWYLAPMGKLHIPLSLVLLMGGLTALLNFALVSAGKIRIKIVYLLAFTILLIALISLPATRGPLIYRYLEQAVSGNLNASQYKVQINIFRERVRGSEVTGGGLASVGENLLLVTGDGLFYLLDFSTDGDQLIVQPLDYQAPINTADFNEQTPAYVRHDRFRTMDVLLLDAPGSEKKQILTSHHYWYPERACYSVRISSLTVTWPEFLEGSVPAEWQTLYEPSPCLPIKQEGKYFFHGHQSGGSLLQTGPQQILLTLGDHAFDGLHNPRMISQDMDSAYGKIIEIDTITGSNRIFTSGHRNPQGLHQDSQGRIWSTEHGPQGGDELNLIQFGKNYGWPMISLGTEYGTFSWPVAESSQPEQDFEEPAFAWVPSIGITSLTSIEGGHLQQWRGDLVIGSLMTRSIYRVRIEQDRPVLVEPIAVNERIRDLVRDKNGHIIFWTDNVSIGLLKEASE
jgi:hypothetical protein